MLAGECLHCDRHLHGGYRFSSRDLSYLISIIDTWSANGYIDSTSNLANSKVYLFSGTIDSTVKQPVMNDLSTMYKHYVSSTNVFYKNNIAAEHSLATDYYGNPCSDNGSLYINNCNFDAAGEILKWIYESLNVNFPAKSGGQMVAINIMIDRIVSGDNSAPYTCSHWYDNNVGHIYYGRAYTSGGNVYAINANQYLGYYSVYAHTDVRRTSAGYYAYGSCP